MSDYLAKAQILAEAERLGLYPTKIRKGPKGLRIADWSVPFEVGTRTYSVAGADSHASIARQCRDSEVFLPWDEGDAQ